MRLTKAFRCITSATKFKFAFFFILIEGVLCVQNQGNTTGKNTTTTERKELTTNGPVSKESAPTGLIIPITNSLDENGPQRKDSSSRPPAPVRESAESESEDHKEYIFENDSVHETISPVHEVDQHTTTVSNQEIHIPETQQESVGFRPSMHLGQIGEINFTGTIMNPFNKVLENAVNPKANFGTHQPSVREKMVKFYDTDNGYKPESVKAPPIPLSEYFHNLHNFQSKQHHQNQFAESDYSHRTPAHDMKIIQGVLSMTPITFEKGNYYLGATEKPYQYVNVEKPQHHVNVEKPYQYVDVEKPHYYINVEKPHHYVNIEKPHHYVEHPYPQVNLQKPYSLLNTEKPDQFVFEKYVKFPNEDKFLQPYAQSYEHIKPFQYEYLKKPEFEFEHYKKPELDLGHYKKPELDLGHYNKPEFDLGHYKIPELDLGHYNKPKFDLGHYKKPELDFEHFKKPELDFEHFKKPEILVDYLQPGLHGSFENFGKPENVFYVTTHEATTTKSKKFPYQFQHPTFVSEMPMLHEDSHEFIHHEKRISPWKKIFHLLGAAIPLGLLFAALTPRVININHDNTTEPNIVLAKLRSGNLPAEHKEGRFSDNRDTCEEKSICKMILGGANAKSNLVQNILWNLSNRITDEVAEKNGLQEIFAAVKRKDCGSLTC